MEQKVLYIVADEAVADVIASFGLAVTVWTKKWQDLVLEPKGIEYRLVVSPKEIPFTVDLIKGREDVFLLVPVKVRYPWWARMVEIGVPFFQSGRGYLIGWDKASDIRNFLAKPKD